MENVRAFIAVEFPDEIVKEIARVQGVLETRKFTGKLTELGNLHLTLKFFGEISETKVKEVKKRLSKIEFGEFEASLGEAGTFARRGNPRIVWIKVNGRGMFNLQKAIDEALDGLFDKEERFMSHLTIARVKYVKDGKDFIEYVRKISVKGLKFNVKEFKLKKSELREIGPDYETLGKFKLG